MSGKTELLPCPFCGGEAEVYEMQYGADGQYSVFGVFCVDDSNSELIGLSKYQHGHFIDNFSTEAEAIAAWNARAERGTLTAEQVREAIFHGSVYASYDGAQYYANGINMQAIADELNARAELGSEPPYDELLRCLENDWHIHASWDGLRKFWCIELTEEGVKLRDATHGTLTAEQVRETVEKHWHDLSADYDMPEATALPEYSYDWQAIADELNARAERTCEVESKIFIEGEYVPCPYYEYEMECGGQFRWDEVEPPSHCPNCGGAVKVVDA